MLTLDALNALLAISEETIVEELIVALLASQLAVFFEKIPKLKHVITEDVPRWREALKKSPERDTGAARTRRRSALLSAESVAFHFTVRRSVAANSDASG
jgi:hypothetical protein